jgi:hypothetical protein
VNETDGENSGGGTNTYGSYGSHILPAEVLPIGFCDIANHDGSARCGGNYTLTWAMGPADVLAAVICTPPKMRYYSYDVDIMARTSEEYIYFPGTNMGDTVSHLSVNVDNVAADDVFDQPMLLLISADAAAAKLVADAYIEAGFPAAAINLKPLPASNPNVHLWDRSTDESWQTSRPDILASVFRMSIPEDESSYRKFQQIYWPTKFYFRADDVKQQQPIAQNLRSRTSTAVMDETKVFGDILKKIEENVKQQQQQQQANKNFVASQLMETNMKGFYDDWDQVLALKSNDSFIVPDRDALYGIPVVNESNYKSYILKKGMQLVVIGVIHQLSLSASYSSVGVDVISIATGKAKEVHWFIDQDLVGSCERYLANPSEDEKLLLPYLFAFDIKGNGECQGAKWCAEYSNAHTSILDQTAFEIFERIYLLKETKVGPDTNSVVSAKLLVFQ